MFREHQPALYAFFVRVAGNRADAEDLTQETFARACRAALRYRGDASVRTWLFAIPRRVLMEASRRGLFDRRAEIADSDRVVRPIDHDARLDLEREFATLSLTDRETLMLVDYLGFSPAEAAVLTDIEPAVLRMRLHRARRRLRQRLEVLTP